METRGDVSDVDEHDSDYEHDHNDDTASGEWSAESTSTFGEDSALCLQGLFESQPSYGTYVSLDEMTKMCIYRDFSSDFSSDYGDCSGDSCDGEPRCANASTQTGECDVVDVGSQTGGGEDAGVAACDESETGIDTETDTEAETYLFANPFASICAHTPETDERARQQSMRALYNCARLSTAGFAALTAYLLVTHMSIELVAVLLATMAMSRIIAGNAEYRAAAMLTLVAAASYYFFRLTRSQRYLDAESALVIAVVTGTRYVLYIMAYGAVACMLAGAVSMGV